MKKKTLIKIGIGLLALVIIVIVLFFIVYTQNTQPLTQESHEVQLVVEEGETYNNLLNRLEEDGVIRSAFFTKIKATFGEKNTLPTGVYTFDSSWDSQRVLDEMNNPDLTDTTINISLIEGGWAKDFAQVLGQAFGREPQDYIDLWNDKNYIEGLKEYYNILKDDNLLDENKRVLLEGYIYPDTYNFYMDATNEEITETILNNAQSKLEGVFAKNNTGLTSYELLTLASIVEYEANTTEDMEKVAGVFFNRMDEGMYLQSSVTVCYALYDFEDWTECESESPDNPYNTYKVEGLPPGPILNPSIKALEATLNYQKHDYIYFLADVYGDGSVYYQETYAEHEEKRIELLGY